MMKVACLDNASAKTPPPQNTGGLTVMRDLATMVLVCLLWLASAVLIGLRRLSSVLEGTMAMENAVLSDGAYLLRRYCPERARGFGGLFVCVRAVAVSGAAFCLNTAKKGRF